MKNVKRASFLAAFLLSCAVVAQDKAVTEQQIVLKNGQVNLSGTLIQPGGSTNSPAIVYLHGSGPMTREGFRPYAEEFAKLGIASLFYDKRGTGSSEGSWITSSLDDLAEDASAAVEFLKTQEGIDPSRIGFWGISQGGWIAPLAASKVEDIGFMMVVSGGGASPRQSELFSYQKQFEHKGLSEEEQEKGLSIANMFFDYLATGEERNSLLEALDEIKEGRLSFLAKQIGHILPSERNRVNWSWVGAYEPVEDIQEINCPVLLLFGDKDMDQPTDLALEKWRKGLQDAGNEQSTVMLFPGAAHGIRIGGHHQHRSFADGYWEVQIGWLWRNVLGGSME